MDAEREAALMLRAFRHKIIHRRQPSRGHGQDIKIKPAKRPGRILCVRKTMQEILSDLLA